MRFQQLKRDPNAVMRKKLVKSKKNWIVVSSLSIAGGLFLMGGPSTVAKADAATESTKTEVVAPSTTPTPAKGTESTPAPAAGTETQASKDAAAPTGNTADKDAEVAPDANKDAAPVVAPEKVQEQAPATGAEATEEPKEEAPVDEKTVEEPVADTLVKSRLAAQPESTAVGEEIPTDVPADTETPVEPESTAADEKTPADVPAGTETPVDPAVVGDAQVETAALDGVETPDAVANGLLANAAIAPITPVDAPTTVTDEGNGWKYDKATTTLNINGQLDESDGTDKERWGGHTSEITTISVNTSVTAPKNSSYLFANMTKLTDIKDLNKLQFADADGINVTTSAKGMFRNDSSITSINLSQNNLYYIEDISHMFENDTSLETTIYPIKSPKMNIAHITDASYAYANDTSLVDPGVSDWQVHGIKNLTGMFKNDSNIENLNLKSWYEYPEAKPQTGDSSKGEGMFDGTNLETITINGSMRFDSETALTSTHGTMWVNSYTDPDHGITTPVTGKDFSGVPTFTNGVATGGIGSQFDGSGALDTKYTFAAQQAPAGSIITNIVSIPTNHEGVSIPVIAQGTAGEEITIDNADIPSTITIDGTVYTKQQSTDPIKAIISNSTSTNAESTVTYLGAQVDGGSVEVPITKNGENTGETITLSVDSGYAGGSTTITLDKQIPEGYELKDTSKDKVTITYNDSTTNPYTFSPTTIELVGTPNKVPTIKVNNPDGTETTWDIPAGNYGGKEQTVTDANSKVTGYTTPVLTVEYGKDGTPTITDQFGNKFDENTPVTYTGTKLDPGTFTYTAPTGETGSSNYDGSHRVGDTITIPVPNVDGYTHPQDTVTGTLDSTGKFTPNAPIDYVGTPNKVHTIKVNNPDGTETTWDIPAGNYGDKPKSITNDKDDVYGYVTPVLNVVYGQDGTPVITDQFGNVLDKDNPVAAYTGKPNDAQKLSITNPDGSKDPITLDIPAGHYGDTPKTITAPAIPGYNSPSIIVTYGADGTPTITYANDPTKEVKLTDVLSYTRRSSGSSNTVKPVTPDEGVIEHKVQTIATYSDKPDVEIYQLGSDNKMSMVTNRMLKHQTNWYSDATITVDGVGYYRVATNEWAKVSQAYPYQALNLHIRTYDDSDKALYKAEDVVISNEKLAPSSSWITDRETYVINNTKYYRVATNKFVSADDVYVYSPVNMVVTTHANTYTTVYTAKGAAVTNRSLMNDSSWKVDSITYINGDKYYRVATNEFVKASDVDVNNMI